MRRTSKKERDSSGHERRFALTQTWVTHTVYVARDKAVVAALSQVKRRIEVECEFRRASGIRDFFRDFFSDFTLLFGMRIKMLKEMTSMLPYAGRFSLGHCVIFDSRVARSLYLMQFLLLLLLLFRVSRWCCIQSLFCVMNVPRKIELTYRSKDTQETLKGNQINCLFIYSTDAQIFVNVSLPILPYPIRILAFYRHNVYELVNERWPLQEQMEWQLATLICIK